MENLCITGRITKDAVLDTREVGKVTNFNVAVNKRKPTAEKDENGKRIYKTVTKYIRVTMWRDLAESLVPYLQKGRQVAIASNDIDLEVWMDRQNQAHPVIHLTNPTFEFLDAGKQEKEPPVETVDADLPFPGDDE